MRLRNFSFMGEITSALILIEGFGANHRHYGELPIVVHPRGWLVSLLNSSYFFSSISVHPTVAHFSSLWAPEIHSPRHGNRWISIAARKKIRRLSTDEGTHHINRTFNLSYLLSVSCKDRAPQ